MLIAIEYADIQLDQRQYILSLHSTLVIAESFSY